MFCKEAGFVDIIVEGDAKQVIKVVEEEGLNWSVGALIVHDAKIIFHSFANWSVQHVQCEANAVA